MRYIRERSLNTVGGGGGGGARKREGAGDRGQVKFYPTKRVVAEEILAMLPGGGGQTV